MPNTFTAFDENARVRAALTILSHFEPLNRERHWVRKLHDDAMLSIRAEDGPLRRRALAFLDHAEAFARIAPSQQFPFERIAHVSEVPSRYFDMYVSDRLRWKPLHRWIYSRIGDEQEGGDDYSQLRPILDPAYRMASAISDDPSIIDDAKMAADPVSFTVEERDDAGALTGYLVRRPRIGCIMLNLSGRDMSEDAALIDQLRDAGFNADRTSTVGFRDGAFFVSVPTGRTQLIVDEDLGSLPITLRSPATPSASCTSSGCTSATR